MHVIQMNQILVIELFEVSVIYFMGPFVSSYWMKFILVAVDYVSKWVEAIVIPIIKSKSVTCIIEENIFSKLSTRRNIISNVVIHFLSIRFSRY